jgi:hypothetical protein
MRKKSEKSQNIKIFCVQGQGSGASPAPVKHCVAQREAHHEHCDTQGG